MIRHRTFAMKKAKLKEARTALGLSQFGLAAKAGISLSSVTRAEKANKWPSQGRVRQAYLRALGLAEVTP